ncbi:MAG: TerB family tellurite resistance protein [Pirellulaceae bacterium]|nr:TerB family tellurite resistance protein [Pirellulaceae bacterium]
MKNLDLLRNLVIMSAADGSFSAEEIAMLLDRCKKLGMREQDLQQSINEVLAGTAQLTLANTTGEQEQILEDLLRMMAADGSLSNSEKRLFAVAAAKMGFDGDQLDALIDRLVKSVDAKHSA